MIGEDVKIELWCTRELRQKGGVHNMELGLVGDYIAGLGLDAAKQHMESKIDEHKLKCALKVHKSE